jgi:hypothetical protein
MGLILSFIGRFVFNLPKKIFNFNEKNQKHVHIYAPILYGLIFRLLVTPLQRYIME